MADNPQERSIYWEGFELAIAISSRYSAQLCGRNEAFSTVRPSLCLSKTQPGVSRSMNASFSVTTDIAISQEAGRRLLGVFRAA
jgi:hypothetical protein